MSGMSACPDEPRLGEWVGQWPSLLEKAYASDRHGDLPRWQAILDALPPIRPEQVVLNAPRVRITGECDPTQRQTIETRLRELHPWRKGPFDVHGVVIDSEWRSDWKWARLEPHIAPLAGRLVLDVGCGNGYYLWRMLGAGARRIIGIDPTLLFVMQFRAIRHFAGEHPVEVLPFGIEDVPPKLRAFDTVFSMGVLYHRRSPLDHLLELKDCLRPGGELVLETLVIDGGAGQTLVPEGRYGQMRNVWFLPSPATLAIWLKRCGYRDVRLVNVCKTTAEEQRATDWMRFQSLTDFLDPADPERTREGHPAPRRAIFIAAAPV
jgi:tRNA (mo5U34)-methyltransferase